MREPSADGFGLVPPALVRHIEQVSDRFEAACQAAAAEPVRWQDQRIRS
jgi:hypothetical protein